MASQCFFCDENVNTEICDICNIISYCKLHSTIHKSKDGTKCFPWKVESRPGVGRMVVAARDIECHEIVLEDEPVGLSPTQDGSLACLSCFKLLDEETAYICDCGFAMCNAQCAQHARHQPECQLFVNSGIKSSGKADYPMIMTIRLLTEFDKENELLLDRVSRLMNHREERIKEKRDWERVNKRIVQPIMKISDKWKEDDIQNCVGFIRTNACCAHATISDDESLPDSAQGEVRMWYPSMCLFSHSCCPNLEAVNRSKYGLALCATKSVKKDEELTITYTSLWGSSVARKEDISSNWYFHCSCDRCEDGNDFGSNLDTLKCLNNKCEGWLLPTSEKYWRCDTCNTTTDLNDVMEIERPIRKELEIIAEFEDNKKTVEAYKNFLQKHEELLHSNHWILTQAKFHIVNNETYDKTDVNVIKTIVKQCRSLLSMFENLKLGALSIKGYILYHLRND